MMRLPAPACLGCLPLVTLLPPQSAVHAAPKRPPVWQPPVPPAPAPAPARGSGIYEGSIRDTGQFLPDTTVLARVGTRTLRMHDFLLGYFNSPGEDRPN